MSITSALHNAISGLGAASRSAQVVSSNISNALTPGYGRREIQLSTGLLGGGVRVDGVQRVVSPALISDRRIADADLGGTSIESGALDRIGTLIGKADDPRSLSGLVARLDAQLVEAASLPESEVRQQAVISAGQDLAAKLATATDGVQAERLQADRGIAQSVDALNTGLARVRDLNKAIVRAETAGESSAGLKDQRQTTLDELSRIVPLRELPRANGSVALMSTGGLVLLDPSPAKIEFTPANAMTADQKVAAPLSGLSVNGKVIDMSGADRRLLGGELAAQFEVRDAIGVAAQERLDGFARELASRFVGTDLDAPLPLPAGNPGFFLDGGGPFDPAAPNETGLAGRLTVNPLLTESGKAHRLRDGLGAATPGPAGDARILNDLVAALRETKPAASGSLASGALSIGGLADAIVSRAAGELHISEDRMAFSQARAAELTQQELATGVDTDQEMQSLLLVEQAYGANARVIQAVDEMLQRLMEL